MTILEDLMYKEFIATSKSVTIEDAIKLIYQNHQGVIVVVNENNFPIGILPETNIYKAELLAENLRKIISDLIFDEVEKQTASFGITQILDIDSENTLIRRVSEALRLSKENGKNKVSIV